MTKLNKYDDDYLHSLNSLASRPPHCLLEVGVSIPQFIDKEWDGMTKYQD
jgi:hypothetical protein